MPVLVSSLHYAQSHFQHCLSPPTLNLHVFLVKDNSRALASLSAIHTMGFAFHKEQEREKQGRVGAFQEMEGGGGNIIEAPREIKGYSYRAEKHSRFFLQITRVKLLF